MQWTVGTQNNWDIYLAKYLFFVLKKIQKGDIFNVIGLGVVSPAITLILQVIDSLMI